MKLFDAGCGSGRNLVYFLQNGYDVCGVDADPRAVEATRRLPGARAANFRVENIQSHSFPDEFAEFVLSSAVLHFARDDDEFAAMLRGSWRVLRPGGLFFCRLASSIGIENQ